MGHRLAHQIVAQALGLQLKLDAQPAQFFTLCINHTVGHALFTDKAFGLKVV